MATGAEEAVAEVWADWQDGVNMTAKKRDLTEDDAAHMPQGAGYIHRNLAQQPSGDVSDSPWRYSLMNWGHDPTT
jgi:hypothetical protein